MGQCKNPKDPQDAYQQERWQVLHIYENFNCSKVIAEISVSGSLHGILIDDDAR